MLTPPDAATKWRRPEKKAEALHYAIAWTYIASTHPQSNARTLSLFSTTMSHTCTSDFWLNYRGRLGCTYQTSAESVKFKLSLKSDELRGARQVAMPMMMIDLARLIQRSTSTELQSWWRMRIKHKFLNCCSMGEQNARQGQGVRNCTFLQTAV